MEEPSRAITDDDGRRPVSNDDGSENIDAEGKDDVEGFGMTTDERRVTHGNGPKDHIGAEGEDNI